MSASTVSPLSTQVPRRLFISADMEGIAGVASVGQLIPGQFEYETARIWMTAEFTTMRGVQRMLGFLGSYPKGE